MKNNRFKLTPAVYLILKQGDNVLLSQRANTGYQDGNYSLVAGHLEGNELATEAMIREAKEEANIDITSSDLTFAHVSHRLNRGQENQERIDLFFVAEKWKGKVKNNEPNKCSDLSWFDIHNLPSNMLPLIRNVLKDVASDISYSEYLTEPIDE